jgi:hypothetical protein
MKKFAMFNLKSRKGQSLVEAMVAISVLTVGFLGILSLLSKSFFYSKDVSDTMKATYLASEGIEITKNLIDHDVALASESNGFLGGWGSCFSLSPGESKDFEFDYATANCGNLTPYSSDPLLFDTNPISNSYGLYGYASSLSSGATKTNFVRKIRIAENASGTEMTVNSIATWSTGPITSQSINMEDHFYNWQL